MQSPRRVVRLHLHTRCPPVARRGRRGDVALPRRQGRPGRPGGRRQARGQPVARMLGGAVQMAVAPGVREGNGLGKEQHHPGPDQVEGGNAVGQQNRGECRAGVTRHGQQTVAWLDGIQYPPGAVSPAGRHDAARNRRWPQMWAWECACRSPSVRASGGRQRAVGVVRAYRLACRSAWVWPAGCRAGRCGRGPARLACWSAWMWPSRLACWSAWRGRVVGAGVGTAYLVGVRVGVPVGAGGVAYRSACVSAYRSARASVCRLAQALGRSERLARAPMCRLA